MTKEYFRTTVITLLLFSSQTNFSQSSTDARYSLKTIVIDAGHGGSDAGCLGTNSKEKYITLEVAKKVGELIKNQLPGVKVIYTRETDDVVPIHERIAIANNNKADLFISIHLNENSDKTILGTETYILQPDKSGDNWEMAMRENKVIMDENKVRENYGDFNPDSREAVAQISQQKDTAKYQQSLSLATAIEDQFSNYAKRTSRGVKQSGLLILNNTTMPSVMIQLGYLSNTEDEKFLKSPGNKDLMATAIYRAIKKYKDEIEAKRKVEEETRKRLEEETKKKADEEAKRKLEEETAKANAAKSADSIAALEEETTSERILPVSNNDGRLATPCWVIGYAATGSKSEAINFAKDLQNKGFETGYFWIPDYIRGGKNLYRVYVGPFQTQNEANSALKDVKRYRKDAYVAYLETN